MVLTYIWVGFFFVAFAVGLIQLIFFGNTQIFPDMMKAAFEMAETSVMKIGLPLTGVITLFMGLMKIGELGGMIGIMSKVIGPFFQRLFPELPKDHPVNGNIMMNFAANMLGLDSAATPMGLKAMQEMQDLNPNKDTASNAQIMFLVLNTSGLTLIPINIMAQRAIWGAKDPSDIFIPLLIATFCSTLAGLTFVGIKQKINFLDPVFMGYLVAITAAIGGIVYYFTSLPADRIGPVSSMVSNFILMALIVSFLGLGMYRRINVFDAFIEGAKDGFAVVIKLIPYLVGLLVGIALFRTCGALDFLVRGVEISILSIASLFGYVINTDFVQALPTAFLKPLSGGGARAMMIETMKTHGPDSFPARLSCIFQGAADTTLFILAVYFGSVGIKKTRYSVVGGLIADFAGVLGAIFIAYVFFH